MPTENKVCVYLSKPEQKMLEAMQKVFKWSRSKALNEVVSYCERLQEALSWFHPVVMEDGRKVLIEKLSEKDDWDYWPEETVIDFIEEMQRGLLANFERFEPSYLVEQRKFEEEFAEENANANANAKKHAPSNEGEKAS